MIKYRIIHGQSRVMFTLHLYGFEWKIEYKRKRQNDKDEWTTSKKNVNEYFHFFAYIEDYYISYFVVRMRWKFTWMVILLAILLTILLVSNIHNNFCYLFSIEKAVLTVVTRNENEFCIQMKKFSQRKKLIFFVYLFILYDNSPHQYPNKKIPSEFICTHTLDELKTCSHNAPLHNAPLYNAKFI